MPRAPPVVLVFLFAISQIGKRKLVSVVFLCKLENTREARWSEGPFVLVPKNTGNYILLVVISKTLHNLCIRVFEGKVMIVSQNTVQ